MIVWASEEFSDVIPHLMSTVLSWMPFSIRADSILGQHNLHIERNHQMPRKKYILDEKFWAKCDGIAFTSSLFYQNNQNYFYRTTLTNDIFVKYTMF